MNGSQIVNMVMRMVLNRVVRSGVNAGIRKVTKPRRGRGMDPEPAAAQPMTPKQEERARRQARRAARQARREGRS